jgi:predicted amidophosphoribosyltransferase
MPHLVQLGGGDYLCPRAQLRVRPIQRAQAQRASQPSRADDAAHRGALRNVLPIGAGVCVWCHRPILGDLQTCLGCKSLPQHLDLVVPITYAIRGAPIHLALRSYKRPHPPRLRVASALLVARVLHRFLSQHGGCAARAVGIDRFDLIATIPSSNQLRDRRDAAFRRLVEIALPLGGRHRRLLTPTGGVHGRQFSERRYRATEPVRGRAVLLLDDTWTTGGHAQSAAHALREAGASKIALVVVGRYLRPDWPAGEGETCETRVARLISTPFDWGICAVHAGTHLCSVPSRDRAEQPPDSKRGGPDARGPDVVGL